MGNLSEIVSIHASAAVWLRYWGWKYNYEYWIDEHHRVDFIAFKRGKWRLFEVANQLSYYGWVSKINQCLEYKKLAQIPLTILAPSQLIKVPFLFDLNLVTIKLIKSPLNYFEWAHLILTTGEIIKRDFPNLDTFVHEGFEKLDL